MKRCLYFGAVKGCVVFDELLLAEASSRYQSAWKWEETSDREPLVIVFRRVQSHCKLGTACWNITHWGYLYFGKENLDSGKFGGVVFSTQ